MSTKAHRLKPAPKPSPRTVAGLQRCRLFERLFTAWAEIQLVTSGKRVTQQQIADVLGFDASAISRWRYGDQRHHPGWAVLQRMAVLTGRAVLFTSDAMTSESWWVVEASTVSPAAMTLVCEPDAFDAVLLFCVAAQHHAERQPKALRCMLADQIGVRRQHYSSWRSLGKSAEGISPPPWASVLKAALLGGHVVVMAPEGWGLMPVAALPPLELVTLGERRAP